MKLFADYHTHTRYSHGKGTVEDNVRAAAIKGLKAVGITDHGPANRFGVGMRRLSDFDRIRSEAERCSKLYGIRVLVGVEANIVSIQGELDVPAGILASLDIVLAGLHYPVRFKSGRDSRALGIPAFVSRYLPWFLDFTAAREVFTKSAVRAVMRNKIDVFTHPGLQFPIDTASLAKACSVAGTALEISTGHRNITPEFLEVAKREGVRFAINSDAHEPGRVGDLEYGIRLAESAQLDPSRIINAHEMVCLR